MQQVHDRRWEACDFLCKVVGTVVMMEQRRVLNHSGERCHCRSSSLAIMNMVPSTNRFGIVFQNSSAPLALSASWRVSCLNNGEMDWTPGGARQSPCLFSEALHAHMCFKSNN